MGTTRLTFDSEGLHRGVETLGASRSEGRLRAGLTVDDHRRPAISALGVTLSPEDQVFGMSFAVENGVATLRLGGPIDRSSTGAIQEAMLQLADRGFAEVTADLTALSVGPADLGPLAAVVRALRTTGGPARIGSSLPRTRVVLDTTMIEHLVAAAPEEAPADARTPLGGEMQPGDRSVAVARPAALSGALAQVWSLPASHAVVDATLRLVTNLAAETVEGADGVSVSLHRHGRLATVAASNDTVLRMDAHQYDTGEGPCISASEAGHWFHIEALSEEKRWASFVPRAIEEGIASVLSTPLLAAARPVGALNIYSDRERVFGPRQQELAALFSTQASGLLEDAGASVTDEEVHHRVLTALRSREVIAQAQGVIMARRRVSSEEAADVLRDAARTGQATVIAESHLVIASTQRSTPRQEPSHG